MSNLYNRIAELCKQQGITITAMCKASGASRASLSDLKVGRKQSLSAETLDKIANYFDTTVDYLLGRTEDAEPRETEPNEKAPTPEGERPITFDDFTYAMYEEGKELTEGNKKKLLEMAQFFRQQQAKEKQ